MDFTPKPTNSTAELTLEMGDEIYALIKQEGNADLAFKNQELSEYDPSNIKKVDKEADKLCAEMDEYASGNKLLEAEEFHYDEETGEKVIDSEAVYYNLTTESDFKAQFSSEILTVDNVYDDWKGERTWTQIKNGE